MNDKNRERNPSPPSKPTPSQESHRDQVIKREKVHGNVIRDTLPPPPPPKSK